MLCLNVEIKARCEKPDGIRRILRERKARCVGVDRQVDTYFRAPRGRLKLREGNIERALIHYDRPDKPAPKDSRVTLFLPPPGTGLKEVLTAAIGVLVVVRKTREIFFLDNVKFHIDAVDGVGRFVEIEAIDQTGEIPRERLLEQCTEYMDLFGITEDDLIDCSYSDILLRRLAIN